MILIVFQMKLKNSKNYKGNFSDYLNLLNADYKSYETVDYETPTHFNREY